MRPRVVCASFLIRFGSFIQSLAIMVMKPDDLLEFGRRGYERPASVDFWSQDSFLASGLNAHELFLLEHIPFRKGRVLLLGLGGGREAIALSELGFDVTGVDFVPEMIEAAKKNTQHRGIKLSTKVAEISRLDEPLDSYDMVWFSASLYSCVPTSRRRAEMFGRMIRCVKRGGYLVVQFFPGARRKRRRFPELLRKLFALATMGNLSFEDGDMLWANREFVHVYSSEEEIRAELDSTGLELVCLDVSDGIGSGAAVLRR